jgi:iron complex outermembrane receptor protein
LPRFPTHSGAGFVISKGGVLLFLLLAVTGVSAVSRAAENEPEDELDTVVVTATRSNNLVRDEAIRVEVLPQEEIEENLTVRPGNLTTLLNELGGIRMQPTAAALGGTALQMRGLPGRHTLVLEDGLPLLGMQTDSFGLLQTPPLDLARVELIKGVGSALYGGSALGGVLNLVSRHPDGKSEVLLNRSSLGTTDLIGFASTRMSGKSGLTLIGGVDDQTHRDIDHDQWADLPAYRRYTLRPRFFFDGEGQSLFATVGLVDEGRTGGTMPGRTLDDGSAVVDALKTRRVDGGLTYDRKLSDELKLGTRWSVGRTASTRRFEADHVDSALTTGNAEGTIGGRKDGNDWLVGLAVEYEKLDSEDAPTGNYLHVVPAAFVQDEFSPVDSLTLEASARLDVHNRYGTQFSPRLSALFRPTEELSARLSLGTGFAAPTPRLEEIEATSLAQLEPLTGLRVERARNASLDIQWKDDGWEINTSLFASSIRHPLAIRPSVVDWSKLILVNETSTHRVTGGELLVHRVAGVLHFIGSATYLDATEAAPGGGRRTADRTPRWSGELAALFEDEDLGRVGIELGYSGRQFLDENPYRSEAPDFFELGVLAEIKLGRAAVFFNAQNLTNFRQTHYDPLLRPSRKPSGERLVELWAPVAGRTFNLGVRVEL